MKIEINEELSLEADDSRRELRGDALKFLAIWAINLENQRRKHDVHKIINL